MKKTRYILTTLLLLALLFASTLANALTLTGNNVVGSGADTGIDIVVVIDRSGSMRKNDPKNIALAATKALAQVSSVDNAKVTGGVSMAVVAFGYDIISTTEGLGGDGDGFVSVSDKNEMRRLEDKVDANATVTKNEDTNTGLALEKAYQMIDARRKNHPNHKFAVVLLSDGKVDVGDSDGFKKDAKNNGLKDTDVIAESRQKGSDTADKLASEGIPLYCIGVYSGNDTSSLGTDMEDWALRTTGDYIPTNNINEVYSLMSEIYARINPQANHSGLTLTQDKPGKFTVDVGVVQVNILVRPSFSDVSNCKIDYTDLSGNVKSYQASNLTQSSGTGDQYTTISMPSPEAGEYTISISDGKNHDYNLDIFSIRDLNMEIAKINQTQNGDPVTIRLRVTKDGNTYYDQSGKNMPLLTLVNDQGNVVVNDALMQWDSQDNCYTYSFTPQSTGEYTVSAKLVKDNLNNAAPEEILTVTDAPVRVKTAALNPINFTGHIISKYTPVTISYSDLKTNNFENVNNRTITGFSHKLTSGSGVVNVYENADGTGITVAPNTQGQATLEIKAQFDGTETAPVTCAITVEDAQASVKISDFGSNQVSGQLQEIRGLLPVDETSAWTVEDSNNNLPAQELKDVNALFEEPNAIDGESFTVAVKVLNEQGTEVQDVARLDGNALKVKGVAEGSYRVILTATSTDGSTEEIEFILPVVNMLTFYIIIAAGALALLLLIIIIIVAVRKKGKPAFKGMLVMELRCDDDYSNGAASLVRYGKKPVKLSTLCVNNHVDMFSMRGMMDKIIVSPRKGGSVSVEYNIKGLGKGTITLHPMEDRTIEINDDRWINLSFNDGNDDF